MRKRTINAKYGYAEVKDARIIVLAWRGEERLTIRLECGDYEVLDLIRKSCALAAERREKHEAMARSLRESVQEADRRLVESMNNAHPEPSPAPERSEGPSPTLPCWCYGVGNPAECPAHPAVSEGEVERLRAEVGKWQQMSDANAELVRARGVLLEVSESQIQALDAEVQSLREALADAVEGMEDMVGYVGEYFREKWGHDDYIERAKAKLAAGAGDNG